MFILISEDTLFATGQFKAALHFCGNLLVFDLKE